MPPLVPQQQQTMNNGKTSRLRLESMKLGLAEIPHFVLKMAAHGYMSPALVGEEKTAVVSFSQASFLSHSFPDFVGLHASSNFNKSAAPIWFHSKYFPAYHRRSLSPAESKHITGIRMAYWLAPQPSISMFRHWQSTLQVISIS
jgi:O-glycosyl hydrolase